MAKLYYGQFGPYIYNRQFTEMYNHFMWALLELYGQPSTIPRTVPVKYLLSKSAAWQKFVHNSTLFQRLAADQYVDAETAQLLWSEVKHAGVLEDLLNGEISVVFALEEKAQNIFQQYKVKDTLPAGLVKILDPMAEKAETLVHQIKEVAKPNSKKVSLQNVLDSASDLILLVIDNYEIPSVLKHSTEAKEFSPPN